MAEAKDSNPFKSGFKFPVVYQLEGLLGGSIPCGLQQACRSGTDRYWPFPIQFALVVQLAETTSLNLVKVRGRSPPRVPIHGELAQK